MSAVELACSECQGRLLVEQFGIVVACPHCGAHLSIPKEMDPNAVDPAATPVEPVASPTESTTTVAASSDALASTGSSIIVKSSSELEDSSPAEDGDIPEFMRPVSAEAVEEIPDFTAAPASESVPEVTTPPEVSAVKPAETPAEPVTPAEPASTPVAESKTDAPDFSGLGDSDGGNVPDFSGFGQADDDDAPMFPGIKVDEPAKPATTPVASEAPEPPATPVEPVSPPVNANAETSNGPDFSGFGQDDNDDAPAFPSFDTPTKVAESQPAAAVVEAAPASTPATASTASSEPMPKDDTVAIRKRRASTKSLPNLAFQVWLSYTILITFIAGLLWYRASTSKPHQLESLPDVRPKLDDQGEVSVRIAPEAATLPKGHTLKLGETQRFGNIEVTPLRVTQGSLKFVHHANGQTKDETDGPVFKLWLKFKNVSEDQVIDPLDSTLVFTRGHIASDREGWHANNFLATREQKTNDVTGDVMLVYDHIVVGDWDLKGQDLGKKLKPGESLETFIPSSTDGLGEMKGDLLWRVHFRKGFSPAGYGVTTLVEVEFNSDDIGSDA